MGLAVLLPATGWGLTFTVTSNGDADDQTPGDGVCAVVGSEPTCTLRAAIQEGNTTPGTHLIAFDLPSGSHVIRPTSLLPAITGAIDIDGFTQSGSAPNSQTPIDDSVVLVTIDAQLVSPGLTDPNTDAVLVFDGPSSYVRGLRLIEGGSLLSGMIVLSGTGLSIGGNHIEGFGYGVLVQGSGVVGTRVGEGGVGSRNLLTRNQVGVFIRAGASQVVVANNFIGVDANGFNSANFRGIRIHSSDGNLIGGAGRNVLASTSESIEIVSASNNEVSNNSIGTYYDGSSSFGTGGPAVRIGSTPQGPAATGNRIEDNVISTSAAGIDARNGRNGDDNRFVGNRFIAAGGIGGIVLSEYIADNDPLDADSGPNGLQNFPVITNVASTGEAGVFDVAFRLESTPFTTFLVEVSSEIECYEHPAFGHRYGGTPVGVTPSFPPVGTNGDGVMVGTIRVTVPPDHTVLMATATSIGSVEATSEHSECVQIGAPESPGRLGFATETFGAREGRDFTTVRVVREDGAAGPLSVDWATVDDSAKAGAGNDYEAATGTLTFSAGELERTFQVRIWDDAAIEPDERFIVTLSSTDGSTELIPGRDQTYVEISDDDVDLVVIGDSNVNFGAVVPGATSERTVVVRNRGFSDSVGIASVALAEASGPFRIVDESCTPSLPALQTCSIVVAFEPGLVGAYQDSLVVTPNPTEMVQPVTVSLAGVATSDADVRLRKAANASNVARGEVVEFRLDVDNSGPAEARNVVVEDSLPSGMSEPTITSPGATSFDPESRVLRWSVDEGAGLAPGASTELRYEVTINLDFGQLTNRARIAGSDAPDSNTSNNAADHLLAVGGADLTVRIVRVTDRADNATRTCYRVEGTVENLGPGIAGTAADPAVLAFRPGNDDGASVTDCQDWESISNLGGYCFSPGCERELTGLQPGEVRRWGFYSGAKRYNVEIVAPQNPPDPNPANNRDSYSKPSGTGGCSALGGPVDPTLPVLVAAAVLALMRRRRGTP